MKRWILILGQHPGLSVEEVLIFFSARKIAHEVVDGSGGFLLISCEQDVPSFMKYFGGVIKIAEWRASVSSLDEVDDLFWIRELNFHQSIQGKFIFGFSQYGLHKQIQHLHRQGLRLKKTFRDSGAGQFRLMANSAGQLSSVAVAKNHMLGRELIFTRGQHGIHVGVTRVVQDFVSYGYRDYGRPERDTDRGMLPPKVAQMMLNYARWQPGQVVLDPFCGLGTILQEASLLPGLQVLGSDRDKEAIVQAERNIAWLNKRTEGTQPLLRAGSIDQLSRLWSDVSVDAIVTEPYMGSTSEVRSGLSLSQVKALQTELTDLYTRAFQNFAQVLKSLGYVVMIWPIFNIGRESYDLPLMYPLQKSGWTFVKPLIVRHSWASFLSKRGTLIYHRPGQIISREIVIWRKK